MPSIDGIEILLLISAFVAILARRLRLPNTVGLVLAGGAFAVVAFSVIVQGLTVKPLLVRTTPEQGA